MTDTKIDLRRYAAMIEEAVKAAFIAEKLPIHIHRVVQGPHTMTMVVSLHQPTQSGIGKALRMSDALAARVHVSPVRGQHQRRLHLHRSARAHARPGAW